LHELRDTIFINKTLQETMTENCPYEERTFGQHIEVVISLAHIEIESMEKAYTHQIKQSENVHHRLLEETVSIQYIPTQLQYRLE